MSERFKFANTGEFARIAEIDRIVGPPLPHTKVGIGDDAAVLQRASSPPLLVCTDAMIEGIHFDLALMSPRELGHKALAACLSDIAAMNGKGLSALFSLAIPSTRLNLVLNDFYEGAAALARSCEIDIVGGDLVSSRNDIFIDVTCIGESHLPITRSGARPGDWVAVSGTLGASAAGLYGLQHAPDHLTPFLRAAHLCPHPRFDLLPALNTSNGLCTSMIDISDGLASELHHLARASDVGFAIEENLLPFHEETTSFAKKVDLNPLPWALEGGEDYQLLVTLDPSTVSLQGGRIPGFVVIGRTLAPENGINLLCRDGSKVSLEPTGFNHFR